ncbi:hypothetical protein PENSPDRAFT_332885 [Peniophora sp. CONT]|nr:hypothetical protein PENSPDRAFT_332885 [Peniophora sp. CONT]
MRSPLLRCLYKPGDAEVAPPYELREDPNKDAEGRCTYSFQDPDHPYFRVERSEIYIMISDAGAGDNRPRPRTIVKKKGGTITSRVIAFPEDSKSREEWLAKTGEYIAAVMFGKPKDEAERPFVLADFPDNMAFYLLEKTHSDRPYRRNRDVYLRSNGRLRFATPHQFSRHAMWLMDGLPRTGMRNQCLCKFCQKRIVDPKTGKMVMVAQEPITRDLNILAGYPVSGDT